LLGRIEDQSIGRSLDLSIIYNLGKMFRRTFFTLGEFVESGASIVGFLNLKRGIGSNPSIVRGLIQSLVRVGGLLELLGRRVSELKPLLNNITHLELFGAEALISFGSLPTTLDDIVDALVSNGFRHKYAEGGIWQLLWVLQRGLLQCLFLALLLQGCLLFFCDNLLRPSRGLRLSSLLCGGLLGGLFLGCGRRFRCRLGFG
jgi:hypothetical protein